ncbi:hypothetical protein [Pseudooceanicola nanhaiensis]|jgi:hypothetical protein|uniref:Uncharacterized protein n=1 Tax=Pseudooceanicola nanhaiensis TaxID=375761 RepID=A0A917TAN4_9RHOB|nr:hypothetical protein [Pseudooceanicola nanhaiensis]GGM15815.1 hypothetical protein GCM10011534_42270 [Pseudooceanicola nanhaiensis]
MINKLGAATVFASMFFSSGAALANDADTIAKMDMEITAWVEEFIGEHFQTNQISLLKDIGMQIAIARNCDGLDLDEDKLADLLGTALEGHDSGDADYQVVRASMQMSLAAYMATGQAVHALNPELFCEMGEAEVGSTEGSSETIVLTMAE